MTSVHLGKTQNNIEIISNVVEKEGIKLTIQLIDF